MSIHHMSKLGIAWVTTFGLGNLRPAPGTWGSLPPVLLAAVLLVLGIGPRTEAGVTAWSWPAWIAYHVVLLVVGATFTFGCLRWGDEAEAVFGKKDPGSVCADETAGVCIPLMFLPAGALSGEWAHWTLLLAFLSFRFFDILKAPPARGLQKHPGGVGIVLDDLIAGAQALVVVQVFARVFMG